MIFLFSARCASSMIVSVFRRIKVIFKLMRTNLVQYGISFLHVLSCHFLWLYTFPITGVFSVGDYLLNTGCWLFLTDRASCHIIFKFTRTYFILYILRYTNFTQTFQVLLEILLSFVLVYLLIAYLVLYFIIYLLIFFSFRKTVLVERDNRISFFFVFNL